MTDEENVQAIVSGLAIRYARRYHGYVEREDIKQELHYWMLTHPRQVARWEDEENGAKKLATTLGHAAQAYCASIKAQSLQYEPYDEYFFSKAEVKLLLECVFDKSKWLEPPKVEDDGGGRGKRPASEGNNWLATLADVARAFETVDDVKKSAVLLHFRGGYAVKDIAAMDNVSTTTIYERIDKAVKKIHESLGGRGPNHRAIHPTAEGDRTCECGHMWRGRKAMSNAAARATTEGSYSEY